MSIEKDFEAHLLGNLDIATARTAYLFSTVRKMIKRHGAVITAKRLLDPANLGLEQAGFKVLAESGLLALSLEQAVVDFAGSGLFPASIIASARSRLLLAKNRMKRRAQ